MSWLIRESYRRRRQRETVLTGRKQSGRFSICLVYPNRYHLGMSNLGFLSVHALLNGMDDVLCDRAFFPDPDELRAYRATGTPLLSLEAERPVADFRVVAFSVSFEADYPAIPDLLSLASIPLFTRDRGAGSPLIIGGGAALFLNPEPVADFFDLLYLGEAEPGLPPLIEAIRSGTPDRRELLPRLSRHPSVYVPSCYELVYDGERILRRTPLHGAPERVDRAILPFPAPPARSTILTPETEFSSMPLVEVSRGCPRGCRFCAAGFIYHPYRTSPTQAILDSVNQLPPMGKRIGLVGAAVSEHPDIETICSTIVERGGEFSLSSLRIDSLSPTLLDLLRRVGCRSVAIAPEGGSQRLRDLIRKGIDEDQILTACDRLIDHDILNLKLYVIIGLPTETMEDLHELIDLVGRIRGVMLERSRPKGRIGRITLSVNPFIPKPFTPFQWCGMEPLPLLEGKVRHLRDAVRTMPNIDLQVEPLREAWLQALLSRGDRRLGEIIARGGVKGFLRELKRSGYPADRIVTRTIPVDEILPWGFIGPDRRTHLRREYELALGLRV